MEGQLTPRKPGGTPFVTTCNQEAAKKAAKEAAAGRAAEAITALYTAPPPPALRDGSGDATTTRKRARPHCTNSSPAAPSRPASSSSTASSTSAAAASSFPPPARGRALQSEAARAGDVVHALLQGREEAAAADVRVFRRVLEHDALAPVLQAALPPHFQAQLAVAEAVKGTMGAMNKRARTEQERKCSGTVAAACMDVNDDAADVRAKAGALGMRTRRAEQALAGLACAPTSRSARRAS
jgi:hypothetical protein